MPEHLVEALDVGVHVGGERLGRGPVGDVQVEPGEHEEHRRRTPGTARPSSTARPRTRRCARASRATGSRRRTARAPVPNTIRREQEDGDDDEDDASARAGRRCGDEGDRRDAASAARLVRRGGEQAAAAGVRRRHVCPVGYASPASTGPASALSSASGHAGPCGSTVQHNRVPAVAAASAPAP